MSIGKVTVWYMTEEERLAYIEKYPIVPTEKPKGATFSDIHTYGERKKEAIKGSRVIDRIDKNLLLEMYLSGKTLSQMAKALSINASTLNNYLYNQRKIDPEKWPYRTKK